ncbi:hypothetical protein FPOA_12495 [Fusarium poae]|uniref:Protein kinase domain-containing protein n=1 Tax=Fusarium poae TaxID=36050 RepID=A0A1B8A910_FUSPO|nr:hypothetical protein FPOA_12495 [Fusarium poae]
MMDSDEIPSSQGTVEAPPPGSSSENATAILTPSNDEARWAFKEVVDWLQEQTIDPIEIACKEHTRKCMWISSKLQPDPGARRVARKLLESFSSSSSSISSAQGSSSPHRQDDETPYEIWTGHYFLSIDESPRMPRKGWTVGSLRDISNLNDIVLTIHTKHKMYQVRQRQATFQIHHTGLVCLRSGSERATTRINGSQVSARDVCVLKENAVELTFGALCYRLEYARGSRAEGYTARLQHYLSDTLDSQVSQSTLALTPTPSEQGSITIGQWTLTTGTIGVGGSGRVSVGMNRAGKLVALKRIHVGKDREYAQQRRTRLESLAALCARYDEERILRLVEVITDEVRATNNHADWWFVLDPAAESTLVSLHVEKRLGEGNERTLNTRTVLIEILEATQFLHKHGWIHGDIKPPNVGIRNWSSQTRSIVLLDLDDAQKSPPPGQTLPARPGTDGTIGWLAPERELDGYNETDVQYGLGIVDAEENLSQPFIIQRLQPPGSISSPDSSVASARKYDPPTNFPPPLSRLQFEALHNAPFTSDRALKRRNVDDYSDAPEDLNANAEEVDEGKEEAITASCYTESQCSSPPKPILTPPYRLHMLRAKF